MVDTATQGPIEEDRPYESAADELERGWNRPLDRIDALAESFERCYLPYGEYDQGLGVSVDYDGLHDLVRAVRVLVKWANGDNPSNAPLFDVPDNCPKCGYDDIALAWFENLYITPWDLEMALGVCCEKRTCPEGEHMHWSCRCCHYQLRLPPRDRGLIDD